MDIRLLQTAIAIAMTTIVLAGCKQETPDTLVQSSKEYLEKKDTKAAIIQLKNALQKNPDMPEARYLLGRALLDSGDPLGAEKELRKARELKYPDDQVLPALARALQKTGRPDKVLAEFADRVLPTPAANAELQTAVGDAALAVGKAEVAGRAYEKALTASPGHLPAQLGVAQLLAVTGDLPRALAAIDSILEKHPQSADAWQAKGSMLLASAKPDLALTAYRKALDASPDSLSARSAVVFLLSEQKNAEAAKKEFAVLKQRAPAHPQTLYLQALLAYRDRDFASARQAIQQHLKAAPNNQAAQLLAAAIEYELNSYAQAETYINKVLQTSPNHVAARRVLILGNLKKGAADKALEALTPLLEKSTNDPSLLTLAGEVYMVNGDPQRAAEYFDKAARLDPADASKRTALAVSHFAAGGSEKALQELEQSSLSDSGTRADMLLIGSYMRRRDYPKALNAIARLEQKQPKSAVPHQLRGVVMLATNDTAGARGSFERALQLDPRYLPAATALSKLDLAENKPDAAKSRFDAILAKDPGNVQALLGLAQLRAATGAKAEDVTALIRKAIAAQPAVAAPRIALIGYYVGAKDPQKAVTAAQEAVAAIPNNASILDAAGRAAAASGDTNQALTYFSKLAALQPASPEPLMRVAEVYASAKNIDAAVTALRKALSVKPGYYPAQQMIVTLLSESGRLPEALAIARDIQKQRPKEAAGYALEGDILAARGKAAEATAAYQNGLKNARTTELALRVHRSLLASRDIAAADRFSAGWLKEHPRDNGFRLYLAESATKAGDYATAARYYTSLLEAQPNSALILNNLAWVGAQLKDARAIEYAERANTLAPNQPPIMDTLGVLLAERGDTARSIEILQKATTLAPQAGMIRLNLAKSLLKAGKKEAAKKELTELLKLGDSFQGRAEAAELMRAL